MLYMYIHRPNCTYACKPGQNFVSCLRGEGVQLFLPNTAKILLVVWLQGIDLLVGSHMNMGDLYVFDRFKAAALGSKICTEIFVLSLQFFAEIPMIFCTHVSWLVPECSAKFRPKCSRFLKMPAILHRKITLFALFSQSILVTPTKFDLKRP